MLVPVVAAVSGIQLPSQTRRCSAHSYFWTAADVMRGQNVNGVATPMAGTSILEGTPALRPPHRAANHPCPVDA